MSIHSERLLKDMRQVLERTQALLDAGGDQLGRAREGVAERLAAARTNLLELEREIERDVRRRARRVEHYAEDHPWQVAAAALTVGLVLGALLGLGAGPRRD